MSRLHSGEQSGDSSDGADNDDDGQSGTGNGKFDVTKKNPGSPLLVQAQAVAMLPNTTTMTTSSENGGLIRAPPAVEEETRSASPSPPPREYPHFRYSPQESPYPNHYHNPLVVGVAPHIVHHPHPHHQQHRASLSSTSSSSSSTPPLQHLQDLSLYQQQHQQHHHHQHHQRSSPPPMGQGHFEDHHPHTHRMKSRDPGPVALHPLHLAHSTQDEPLNLVRCSCSAFCPERCEMRGGGQIKG